MDWISDCARDRADSDREFDDVVRERDADREVVPECDREPLDRRCRPLVNWRKEVREARGLLVSVFSSPTLSRTSVSSGTSIKEESSRGSSSSESRTKGIGCPNVIDMLDMSLSVLVRPLSRRVRDPAQPGKATGDAEDWEPGDGAGTVRALLRV